MRHHREDVVAAGVGVLDRWGLADLTMRRLAAELDVRPSALYHHFPDKQTLLAAVADEILLRGRRPALVPGRPWDEAAGAVCRELRDAMLAYRDGAELVATTYAFGLGARAPYDALVAALLLLDLPDDVRRTAARTLLHFVFGHVADEQTQMQAASVGAISAEPRPESDFEQGLGLILAGLRAHPVTHPAGHPATHTATVPPDRR